MFASDLIEDFWDLEDLEHAYQAALGDGEAVVASFETSFLRLLGGAGAAVFQTSARSALRSALRILGASAGVHVLLPAFCCHALAQDLLREGLTPVLYDSGALPGSVDWDQCLRAIRSGRIMAAVVPHLFGLPLDIRPFVEQAHRYGVAVIEDCALCLGGSIDGCSVGTLGDFAIFSFNALKPFGLAGGGMLVRNPGAIEMLGRPLRTYSELRIKAAPPHVERTELLAIWNEQLAWKSGRPETVWRSSAGLAGRVLRRPLAELRTQAERYLTHPLLRMASDALLAEARRSVGYVRAALGLRMLERYPAVLAARERNYQALAGRLERMRDVQVLRPPESVRPAWPFAKVLLPEGHDAAIPRLEDALADEGYMGGRIMWPRTVEQELPLALRLRRAGSLLRAHRLAVLSFDLPVHQKLTGRDLRTIGSIVLDTLATPDA